jgi:hypothetical protein
LRRHPQAHHDVANFLRGIYGVAGAPVTDVTAAAPCRGRPSGLVAERALLESLQRRRGRGSRSPLGYFTRRIGHWQARATL